MISLRMRGWLVVAGLLVSSSNTSHAEVSALASATYGQARIGDDQDEFASSFAVQGDVGYRIEHEVAIGAHVGVGSKAAYTDGHPGSMFNESWDYDYRPIDLGVSAQFAIRPNIVFAPWVGVQNGMRQQECFYFEDKRLAGNPVTTDCEPKSWELDASMRVAGGLSLALDAWRFDDKSRISIVGSATAAQGKQGEISIEPYRAVWLGVGYRFWK
jgi:hypothetical protein